jgi:hypothetical protein
MRCSLRWCGFPLALAGVRVVAASIAEFARTAQSSGPIALCTIFDGGHAANGMLVAFQVR